MSNGDSKAMGCFSITRQKVQLHAVVMILILETMDTIDLYLCMVAVAQNFKAKTWNNVGYIKQVKKNDRSELSSTSYMTQLPVKYITFFLQ